MVEPSYAGEQKAFKPHETNYDDAKSFGKLVTWMARRQDEQRDRLVRRILRNLAWLAGDQYVRYNALRQCFELPPDVPSYRIQSVFNMIYPWCETRLAKLIRDKPVGQTRPASNSEQDIAVARLQKSVLQSYENFLEVPRKNREALLWLFCSGFVAWKTCWDPMAGDSISVEPQDLPPEMMLQYQLLGKSPPQTYRGEIEHNVVPALSFMFYPIGLRDLHRSMLIVESMELEASEIESRYGEYGVTADDAIKHGRLTDGPDAQRLRRYRASSLGDNTTDDEDSMCVMYEAWLKPRLPRYEGGRMGLFFADGTPITEEIRPIPYFKGKHPYTFMHEKPVPDSIAGTCTVREAIPVQDEINRYISTQATSRRWHATGKYVRYENDNMTPLLSDDPHQVIKVKGPAYKPELLPAPTTNTDADKALAATKEFGDYIVGANEITRGKTQNTKTATQAEIATDADDSRVMIVGTAMNEAQASIGTKILEHCQMFVPEQRLARVVGEKNYPDLIYWKGDDLKPQNYGQAGVESGVDVYVTAYTQLGMSPIAKRNTIKELAMFMSQVQDPKLRRLALKAFDVGDEEALYDDEAVHRSRANEKINMLNNGLPIEPPEVQENELVHHDVFEGWMNTAEYRETARKFPNVPMMAKTYLEQCLQQAEDKMASDQYRVALAQARMGMKYQLMSQGGVQPLAFGAVDTSNSARRLHKEIPAGGGKPKEAVQGEKKEKKPVDTVK